MNFFEGTLVAQNGSVLFEERADKGPGFRVPLVEPQAGALRAQVGRSLTLGLRPEHLRPVTAGDGADGVRALLERVEAAGSESLLHLSNGNHTFIARSSDEPAGKATGPLDLRFDMSQARYFDAVTGVALSE